MGEQKVVETQEDDPLATLLADVDLDQKRLRRAGALAPEAVVHELAGTILSYIRDLSIQLGSLRDAYFDLEERIEEDEPIVPVMDKEDVELFVQICSAVEGLAQDRMELIQMAGGVATAAEFKTKIGNPTPERLAQLQALVDLAKKGTDRITELSTSEEDAEEAEEQEQPEAQATSQEN